MVFFDIAQGVSQMAFAQENQLVESFADFSHVPFRI
jgi:hypothetical protein